MSKMADRVSDFRSRFATRRSKAAAASTQHKLQQRGTPPDVADIRAKSQRHGKVAADRWNQ